MQDDEDKKFKYPKNTNTNFFIKEIKERIHINKKNKEFKETVDFVKNAIMDRIEEEHNQKDKHISMEIDKIEQALLSDDCEKIKEALKNYK